MHSETAVIVLLVLLWDHVVWNTSWLDGIIGWVVGRNEGERRGKR